MNLSESYKKRLSELAGIKKTPSTKSYFRALNKNMGKIVTFEPKGYYEAASEEGHPIDSFGEYLESEVGETAASEYVGGAIMGNFSMHYLNGKILKKYFIYKIVEKPDVDISHWSKDDFSHLGEVRYRKPVIGKLIGVVNLNNEQSKALVEYYNMLNKTIENQDSETESTDEELNFYDYYDSGKFEKMLKSIKPL